MGKKKKGLVVLGWVGLEGEICCFNLKNFELRKYHPFLSIGRLKVVCRSDSMNTKKPRPAKIFLPASSIKISCHHSKNKHNQQARRRDKS
jgi:hypothetical protein